MNERVLYLSYDGMTDPLGQSQVIPYIQELSKKGYSFTVLSFEKPHEYKKRNSEVKAVLDQDKIRWIPLKYHKSPPVISTLFDVWSMYIEARQIHDAQAFDLIHCRSYISALIGLRMKKAYGTKFLFDMRGFWVDERVEGGIWNLKNPLFRVIYRFFKKKEKAFFETADHTISLTQNGKDVIRSWKHIKNNPVPIRVIPCCADLRLFNRENIFSSEVSDLQKKLNIKGDDFVLLYLGSLGTWYMLDEMLDFFVILLEYKPSALFLFVTREQPELILRSALNKEIPSSKLIITSAERNDLPNYIALAKLSIFFIKPVFSKKASSPTKQGELMGMGIPIICNSDVGDTAKIIRETDSGAVIDEFTEGNYRDVCNTLEEVLKISSSKISANAQQYCSLQKGVEAYCEVYKNLL